MKNQTVAICFTNFGPYHYARLHALGQLIASRGGRLLAYEMASREDKYPWTKTENTAEPTYQHVCLFPNRTLESLSKRECQTAMASRLDIDRPTAVGIVGYVRPESLSMLSWAKANNALRILLSETQRIDHRRVWWKEAIKTHRVKQFQSALVGGQTHRDYLVDLGMPPDRIFLGYNAVGNSSIAAASEKAASLPPPLHTPYFLSVCRFAKEKNLEALIKAYASHVHETPDPPHWPLVLAGDGLLKKDLINLTQQCGVSQLCHWPGFLTLEQLIPWYTHCGAFVLPSLSEPWGLVINEAAICGSPLLVSDRCGAAGSLVNSTTRINGSTFDPESASQLAQKLSWISSLSLETRQMMRNNSAAIASQWGPEQFAQGFLSAMKSADQRANRPLMIARR